MKEILCLRIEIDEILEIHGGKERVRMILFHGEADSELFHGRVLPGGVDTQVQETGKENLVSARYILEGRDQTGAVCRVYVENNGVDLENGDMIQTTPRVITDSEALRWLEETALYGTVSVTEERLYVRIYIMEGEEK